MASWEQRADNSLRYNYAHASKRTERRCTMSDQTLSIAFLGPNGTYSDEAARAFAIKLDAPKAELVPCASFTEVFENVDRGKTTYGVVATENALEGPVTATLDNFAFNSSAQILGVHVVDIHHCLITHPDAQRTSISTIASHAQGLGQCRRYITREFPAASTISTSSTAESVKVAMGDRTVAAIATRFAAELYGGIVIDDDIEDRLGNQTSFALIGRPTMPSPLIGTRYKTSVALFMQMDRAGTLNMILSEFAYAGINITMIQSRPTKQALGDYMFFLDLEGRVDDPAMQTALNCLRLKLREVKVLGSYPID